jgi:FkbM family methyltransferase
MLQRRFENFNRQRDIPVAGSQCNRVRERNVKALLKSLAPPAIYEAMHKIKMRVMPPIQYRIGEHLITLPFGHPLPTWQSKHKLYDRFLPVLCSHILSDGIIVDIGANVGDTVVAIMQTCTNPIIAIEYHLPYFVMLRDNLAKIDPDHRVTSIQALVGSGSHIGALVASHGLATLSNSGSSQFKSLDDILKNWLGQIALIKVDTDGFDADVILSGMDTITSSQPMLFWESGTVDAVSFKNMYEKIATTGYNRFWVFDNFGNLMLRECGVKILNDLDLYVESQYKYKCDRSFFYFDVLAATDKTAIIARDAVAHYRKKFIEI